jgi:hypothetical protein
VLNCYCPLLHHCCTTPSRSEPRLVLRNVVEVLPSEQVEKIIYWVNAFNSEIEFWRQQTSFLRNTLKYTVIQV